MADPDPAAMPDWRGLNRAQWDERVAVHRAIAERGAEGGGLAYVRQGLDPIVLAELGPVAGQRLVHLQCHFGRDTLSLAERGADVTGLDFSRPAIEAARADAAAQGIAARFVHADLYDAPVAIPPPHGFDVAFTTWGTIGWLPDIEGWAAVIAHLLRPGGRLYFADIHPAALVFDDMAPGLEGRPGWFAPYFEPAPIVIDDPSDYADPDAVLVNVRTVQFMHPLARIVGALQAAGLRLDWLHEHDRVPWRAFRCLVRTPEADWTWPDRPWLPLALSLGATRVQ